MRVASPSLRETVLEHRFDTPDVPFDHHEIHVWLASLSAWRDPDPAHLSTAERERASLFRFPADRERYEKSHVLLRHLLGLYTGKRPSSLVFEAADFGKPFLQDGPRFNLSHAGDRTAVAICRSREVGVDIESTSRHSDPEAILSRFFHPADLAAWQAAPQRRQVDLFFEAWTRQEAVLKALGTGIGGAIGQVPVLAPPAEALWQLYPIEAGAGYKAALAVLP